jgi:hypothetical protein
MFVLRQGAREHGGADFRAAAATAHGDGGDGLRCFLRIELDR